MADLKPEVDTNPQVIYEDDPAEMAKKFPGEDCWRITVSKNDEPVDDRENPPPKTIWDLHYSHNGAWHAGAPGWSTWLRLLPRIHQAGLVLGRRGGIEEAKAKMERRGRAVAEKLRVMASHPTMVVQETKDLLILAADLLCPPETENTQEGAAPEKDI